MYAENARDSYHASLLHLFFATFKLNRLSQGGGLVVSANGGCSVSETIAPTQSDDTAYAGMRSVDDDYMLRDPRLIDVIDEPRTVSDIRSSLSFLTSSCRKLRTLWRCGFLRRMG